ncbi:MAG TPA: hypothetical protein VFW63_11645 [Acidimicrobiales bacterium]|nr:hypothetical protein [Acidimicrobiales bacterium]
MTRRSRLAALVAVAALAAAGCANNDAKEKDVVNAMRDAGLDADQAKCVGDGVWDEFGDDQDTVNDIAAADDTDDFPEDTEDEIRRILDRCLGRTPSGSDTTGTSEPGGSTTTTAG